LAEKSIEPKPMTATKYQSVLQNQRKNPFLNKSGSLDKSLQLSIKENKTPITLTKHGDLASHRSSKSLGYMTMTTAKKQKVAMPSVLLSKLPKKDLSFERPRPRTLTGRSNKTTSISSRLFPSTSKPAPIRPKVEAIPKPLVKSEKLIL